MGFAARYVRRFCKHISIAGVAGVAGFALLLSLLLSRAPESPSNA